MLSVTEQAPGEAYTTLPLRARGQVRQLVARAGTRPATAAIRDITGLPRARRPGPVPWVWYAPTLLQSNLPNVGARDGAEVWMFERFLAAGIGVAGIDVGESYGSPAGTARYDALYDELTQQHGDVDHVQRFSRKPVRAICHQHHDAVRVPTAVQTAVPCLVCEGTLHAVGACSVCEKPLVLRPAFRVCLSGLQVRMAALRSAVRHPDTVDIPDVLLTAARWRCSFTSYPGLATCEARAGRCGGAGPPAGRGGSAANGVGAARCRGEEGPAVAAAP